MYFSSHPSWGHQRFELFYHARSKRVLDIHIEHGSARVSLGCGVIEALPIDLPISEVQCP